MPDTTLATKIKKLQTLVDQTRELLPEIPILAGHHTALETAVQEVKGLDNQAQGLRARRLEVSRLRREAESRCTEARGRLAAALIQHFGPQSERLLSFGVGPRPRKLRRKKAEPPPPPEAAASRPA
jgi:superoxide dismutase